MGNLELVIWLVLVSLPRPWADRDEEPSSRVGRLGDIARSIDLASGRATCDPPGAGCVALWPGSRLDLAVLLAERAYAESGLVARIQAGGCLPHECGGRVRGRPRSVSYWQLEQSTVVPWPDWRGAVGLGPWQVTRAAWGAAKVLSVGRRQCGTVEGAIVRYRGVRGCRWEGARGSVRRFRRLQSLARDLLALPIPGPETAN